MSDRRAFRRPCREEAFRGSPQAEARGAPIPEIHGFESAKPLRDFGAGRPVPPADRLARRLLDAAF
ncbi:hypothetical protein IGS68_23345 [Skermanella sp. TT6]|uniref:Uncharacterized protein n=1 Tax=Skermanella cutis TaxID=2775420 RepID=A0ABX7B3K3_9PROT|nr:hypothetical protein [Skermanella sp. TT6]QQP88914.1 hypothetical protein IGS68_23345 [Skermanella sp. TT6]